MGRVDTVRLTKAQREAFCKAVFDDGMKISEAMRAAEAGELGVPAFGGRGRFWGYQVASINRPAVEEVTMSQITTACPVCGEVYAVGVVGTGVVGGHVCPVKVERDELRADNARLRKERAEAIALALIDEKDWTGDHSAALNALIEGSR